MIRRLSIFFLPAFSWLSGLLIIGALTVLVVWLLTNGLPTLGMKLIFDSVKPIDALMMRSIVFDGIFPAVAGTVLLVCGSVVCAVPAGVLTGIYLSEYAGEGVKKYFNIIYDILAGIPSIVIGLAGFSAAVFLHRHFSERIYPCILLSIVSLSLLILPYIIRTTQISLGTVPYEIRTTAIALGATKLQNIRFILLPQSISGIFSGIILATGRCAEDTAVIMLTGVAATAGIPRSLLQSYEALPYYIYHVSSSFQNSDQLQSCYGAALLLLGISICFFLVASLIKNRLKHLLLYR